MEIVNPATMFSRKSRQLAWVWVCREGHLLAAHRSLVEVELYIDMLTRTTGISSVFNKLGMCLMFSWNLGRRKPCWLYES